MQRILASDGFSESELLILASDGFVVPHKFCAARGRQDRATKLHARMLRDEQRAPIGEAYKDQKLRRAAGPQPKGASSLAGASCRRAA